MIAHRSSLNCSETDVLHLVPLNCRSFRHTVNCFWLPISEWSKSAPSQFDERVASKQFSSESESCRLLLLTLPPPPTGHVDESTSSEGIIYSYSRRRNKISFGHVHDDDGFIGAVDPTPLQREWKGRRDGWSRIHHSPKSTGATRPTLRPLVT